MPGFQDHFSGHAADYARHRPTYPPALFANLAAASPATGVVWDCATGSGQAAVALAEHFDQVIATDASAEQVAHAAERPKVVYRVATAEESGLEDASVDLVTVAQALHWFDHERFFAEVERVLRPGGLFAAWSYGLFTLDEEIDAIVYDFYTGEIDAHWAPERRHVDAGYATIPTPDWEEVAIAAPPMTLEWTVDDALAYLGTWSATRACARATGEDPVDAIEMQMRVVWGEHARTVTWPLAMRALRKPS